MKIKGIILCGMACMATQLYGIQKIQSVSEFDNALRNKGLVLTHFYKKSPLLRKEQPGLYELHKKLNTTVKSSEGQKYVREFENIHFVKANIEEQKLKKLAHRYDIKRNNEFVLFDNARRVSTLRKTKHLSSRILRDFVRDNVGPQILKKIETEKQDAFNKEANLQKQAQKQRELSERLGWRNYFQQNIISPQCGCDGCGCGDKPTKKHKRHRRRA